MESRATLPMAAWLNESGELVFLVTLRAMCLNSATECVLASSSFDVNLSPVEAHKAVCLLVGSPAAHSHSISLVPLVGRLCCRHRDSYHSSPDLNPAALALGHFCHPDLPTRSVEELFSIMHPLRTMDS